MGYKAEEAGIDEEQKFDVQLTSAQTLTPKLLKGMLAGERVTVMSLSAEDAPPGPVRVVIELFLYSVAIIAPWFVWSMVVSIICTGIVIAALVTGIARMLWLMDDAP